MKIRGRKMADGGWNTRSVLDCGPDLSGPLLHPAGSSARLQSAPDVSGAHSKTWRLKLAAFYILISAFCLGAWGQYSVDWFKVAGGGGTSSGGQYSVTGTIGQPEAGVAISGGYSYLVIGGFWSLIAALQTPGAPTLTITFVGPNSVVVSWPSAATDFVLQQNSDLTTTNWLNFGGAVSDDGTTKSITINLPTGYLFFRLNHP